MTSALIFALLMPQSTTYTNPVYPHNFPDPFIVQEGDTFYAYATQNSGDGFQIMSSKNLVDWKHLGAVAKPDWSHDQLWAPELYKWQGNWYFFYSALDPVTNKRDLAVSTGPSPTGPFKHLAKLVLGTTENSGSDTNGAIDGTLYFESGKPYLLYIRESQPRSLKIVELTPDLAATKGEAHILLNADQTLDKGILDAPTLLKRDGTYWLFFSSGWFQSSKADACYRVYAAESKSLLGPYRRQSKPLLDTVPGQTYSPGHQAVFQLANGEWWIAYHAWNAEGQPRYGKNRAGRSLRIDRLTWTPSGPKVDGPSITPQPAPKIK